MTARLQARYAQAPGCEAHLNDSLLTIFGQYHQQATFAPVEAYEDAMEAFNIREGRTVARCGVHSA